MSLFNPKSRIDAFQGRENAGETVIRTASPDGSLGAWSPLETTSTNESVALVLRTNHQSYSADVRRHHAPPFALD